MSQPWEPAAVGLRQPCRRSGTCRTRFRKTIVKKLKREGPGRGVSSIRQTHVGFGGLPGRRRTGEPPGAQPRPGDICAQEQGHREAMVRGPRLSSPQTLRGACLELANVFTQSSAFRDTRKPNRVMTPPYRRRESGPAGDPNHRHTAPAPNCVTGRTSPDSWNPPSTGKKKKKITSWEHGQSGREDL